MGHPRRASSHRGPARLRRGRAVAASASFVVSLVALLGAAGLLPTGVAGPGVDEARAATPEEGALSLSGAVTGVVPSVPDAGAVATALPAGSGTGRRAVFDISSQRVWLVDEHGEVLRSYLVSGSVTDNLKPGSYEVYSRSRHAIGVDDSGTMQYMVRFAHGEQAAIGFHDIPVDQGRLVQTTQMLGTPQSHGCIRQARPDARALWRFAPVGTRVVVVA